MGFFCLMEGIKMNIGEFNFRQDYIENNLLSEDFKNIALLKGQMKEIENEIFVRHPDYENYYISQFGRVISMSYDKPKFLGLFQGGAKMEYLFFTASEQGETHTISVHNAVAKVFCPNFWEDVPLQAHHLNKNTTDNYYRNLILLPLKLHRACDKIKKMVLLKDGKIIPVNNPLDLLETTGLTLEKIIIPNSDGRKPLPSMGGYTVFNIDNNLIGYKYYPQKKDKK